MYLKKAKWPLRFSLIDAWLDTFGHKNLYSFSVLMSVFTLDNSRLLIHVTYIVDKEIEPLIKTE